MPLDNGSDQVSSLDPIEFQLHTGSIENLKDEFKGMPTMYDAIKEEDAPIKIKRLNKSFKIFKVMQLQEKPAISLAMTKNFVTYDEDTKEWGNFPYYSAGEKVEQICFKFFGGALSPSSTHQELYEGINVNEIGEFILEHRGNEWHLTHRQIEPQNRNKGFATGLLKMVEKFIQEYAEAKKEHQKIVINAGQQSVLNMFRKKGYMPQTERDRKNLKRIEEKDQNLEESDASIMGWNGDGTPSGEWISRGVESRKDPYILNGALK